MTKKRIALKIVRRVGICILTTVVLLLIGLLGVVRIMEFGPSKTARNLFVNSAMESSAGGILVTLFFSDEEIARIRAINSIQKTDEVTDSSLISDTTILTQEEKSMIEVIDIEKDTYRGKMMIVRDPSRVMVGTSGEYGKSCKGKKVSEIAESYGAIAATYDGGFRDAGGVGTGGEPDGLVISEGRLKWGSLGTTYGIIGLGRFGESLALSLANSGAEFMVIDKDEEKVREMRDYTENAYVVQTLDKKSLSATGIQNCDVAVVCIGEHIDTSILTTLNLVSMGIKKVIAKARGLEHGEILAKLGAEVVYPEKDMAERLANRLIASQVIDVIQLSEKINISKVMLPDRLEGKTVVDINMRKKFNVNIIAIENNGEVMQVVNPEYVFRNGDILYLSGSSEGLNKFGEWIG